MKEIKIPKPIIVNNETVLTFTFKQFLTEIMNSCEQFAKGIQNIRQYNKIMNVIEEIKDDDEKVSFEDTDWVALENAAKNAGWKHPLFGRTFLPFYDAIGI